MVLAGLVKTSFGIVTIGSVFIPEIIPEFGSKAQSRGLSRKKGAERVPLRDVYSIRFKAG
jgi:hypothetical protein